MNYLFDHRNLKLTGRNEGKIKSYESCSDLRAWSHDLGVRDRYLKEWIKCNMPISVLPICTLSGFLRIMTCKNRGKVAPRCHANCKSKVLLESICTSCQAMKECLKNNENFEKYFQEEEFETSHWPCERCLDALKSIKMFWKIIIEKVFNVNMLKTEHFEVFEHECDRTDSLKSVAKVWQKEMVQQALFVKSITPSFAAWKSAKCSDQEKCMCHCKTEKKVETRSVATTRSSYVKSPRTRGNADKKSSIDSRSYTKVPCKKVSRCTSVHVKTLNVSCEASNAEQVTEELKAYKINIEYLQQQLNVQSDEVERLKKENNSLKIELQNVYDSFPLNNTCFGGCVNLKENAVALVPFESYNEQTETDPAKDIDSEMIITMKNCKNETYKHVSLLQVLHKTNDPALPDVLSSNGPSSQKEDPIDLLTRVQNTFGAIVRREINIASERRHRPKKSDIEATFHRVNSSRSAPSCTTIPSTSESDFVTTKDIKGHTKIINI